MPKKKAPKPGTKAFGRRAKERMDKLTLSTDARNIKIRKEAEKEGGVKRGKKKKR